MKDKIYPEFIEEILNSIADGLFTVDNNFRITFMNEVGKKMIGKESNEILGRTCKEVCNSHLCKSECPVTQTIESQESLYDFVSTIRNKAGDIIPIKLNAASLRNKGGELVGAVVSFRKNIKINGNSNSDNFLGIVGKSSKMRNIYEMITDISRSDAPALITGETGVGKELVASAIVECSSRKDKEFIKINCATIPESLLASELFGHTEGAFTDALEDRIGRFEKADGGTIFLDEIAEIPISIQTQLLRVIQDGTFERVGESSTRKTDIRIIAATNKNLHEQIENGNFRKDLFYRLNLIQINVPALRERTEDIPHLVKHFMSKFSSVYQRDIHKIDSSAMDTLMDYSWPGNIRELENAIEYSFIKSKRNSSVCVCCLPPSVRKSECESKSNGSHLSKYSEEYIVNLLEENNWNQSKVANILGVNRTTIWRHLKARGIK